MLRRMSKLGFGCLQAPAWAEEWRHGPAPHEMRRLRATSSLAAVMMAPHSRRARPFVGLLALLALCAAPVPASAAQPEDPPPAEDTSEIVVSGTVESIERSRLYIQALEMGAIDRQVARWVEPICIAVSGTSEPIAKRLGGRIEATARQIGAKLARGKCKPNLLIVLAQDANAFVAQTRRRSATRLAEIPAAKRGMVFESEAPVRWWYNTDVLGADGRPLSTGTTGLVACPGVCELPSMGQNVRSQSTYSSSVIAAPVIRHIRSAVVVIDVPRAAGHKVDSLGDYAALVALAEIWPDKRPRPVDSILDLFDSAPSPETVAADLPGPTLSAFDRSFLCGLYRMPMSRSGQYQRSFLVNALSSGAGSCSD